MSLKIVLERKYSIELIFTKSYLKQIYVKNTTMASLFRANLREAELDGAHLRGANLEGARVEREQLGRAIGFNPEGVIYVNVDGDTDDEYADGDTDDEDADGDTDDEDVDGVALRDDLVVVGEVDVCPICQEEGGPGVRTNCGHEFHAPCLLDWKRRGRGDCPMCRQVGMYFGATRASK
jgi:hypothetical protein